MSPAVDRRHRHAPLDPALQRARLVEREIMGGLGAQKIDDLRAANPAPVLSGSASFPACACDRPPAVFDERIGDFGDRKHKVHRARHDRAARHAVIAGLVGILRDDESAFFLHRFQSEAAIGAGSRKDHADGARAIFLGQRMQQKIEGQPRAVTRLWAAKDAARRWRRTDSSGRNDIKMIALDRHSFDLPGARSSPCGRPADPPSCFHGSDRDAGPE